MPVKCTCQYNKYYRSSAKLESFMAVFGIFVNNSKDELTLQVLQIQALISHLWVNSFRGHSRDLGWVSEENLCIDRKSVV